MLGTTIRAAFMPVAAAAGALAAPTMARSPLILQPSDFPAGVAKQKVRVARG